MQGFLLSGKNTIGGVLAGLNTTQGFTALVSIRFITDFEVKPKYLVKTPVTNDFTSSLF